MFTLCDNSLVPPQLANSSAKALNKTIFLICY
nr:MAG TPA: hypothetical protein [Caudoviricetes sp.]